MSRVLESIGKTEDYKNRGITRNYVILVLTVIVALAVIMALVGYVLNRGILPNAQKALSLIIYPTERLSTQSYPPQPLSSMQEIDFGTLEGKVIGHTGLPAIGALVIAEKELGVTSSEVKRGGLTANSFVSVEGTYSFKVPSGVY
jgi:hypothetical protein